MSQSNDDNEPEPAEADFERSQIGLSCGEHFWKRRLTNMKVEPGHWRYPKHGSARGRGTSYSSRVFLVAHDWVMLYEGPAT